MTAITGSTSIIPTVDARISHEFAAAVFRVGHSQIADTLTVLDADGNRTDVPLVGAFLNPPGFAEIGAGNIFAGIATQPSEEVDFNIVNAVRNDLVRIRADLFAFNVARGWDVGLGTLNQVRADLAASSDSYISEAVGFAGDLSPYELWEDFQTRNNLSGEVIAQFRAAYPDLVLALMRIRRIHRRQWQQRRGADGAKWHQDVHGIDRVDLWVGGLAERHINGGQVGQTFWVVLHEQFDRLQEGDRFYYIDRFDGFEFYADEFETTTFADIVARNTGLTGLSESIFYVAPVDEGEGDGSTGEDGQDDGSGEDGQDNEDDTPGDDEGDDDITDEVDYEDDDNSEDEDGDEDDEDGEDEENNQDVMITSGNGAPVTVDVAENSTDAAVYDVDATGGDEDHPLVYSIISGNEDGLFTIDPETGAVSFIGAAPSFESPGGPPSFVLNVRAENEEGYDDQQITVRITDVNEVPAAVAVDPDAVTESDASALVAITLLGLTTVVDPDIGDEASFVVGSADISSGDAAHDLLSLENPDGVQDGVIRFDRHDFNYLAAGESGDLYDRLFGPVWTRHDREFVDPDHDHG